MLRAIAVLMVLGRHMDIPREPWLRGMAGWWHFIGWTGVDLFFVLSGFLVSGLLFREARRTGGVHAGRFLIRRGFKIYPSFYVLVLCGLGLLIAGHTPVVWSNIRAEVFFYQNYAAGLWFHTWSLAVEEHFYLLLALALFLYSRTNPDWQRPSALLRAIIALILLVIAMRVANSFDHPYNEGHDLFSTHLRLDSLLFGTLLSHFHTFHQQALAAWVHRSKPLLWTLFAVAAAELSFVPPGNNFGHTFGLTLLYVGFGALLLLCLYRNRSFEDSKSRLVKTLAALGRDSYSIYLWHPVARLIIMQFFPAAWNGWTLLAYLAIALVGGVLMARLIEIPALALRDRLFPDYATAVVGVEEAPALV